MKTSNFLTFAIATLLLFVITSCSSTQNFLNSTVVPAAKGAAKFSKDANENYAIKVTVTDLAEPSRLQPKKNYYVVWLVTKSKLTKNIGQLKSERGFFSSALKGELNTTTAFEPDYVFITAEDDTNTQIPVGTVVLTTKSH